ncbi:MAG: hypothetical protein LBV49_09560, partial [Azonexus sp.]|nr:hypothetical protein [Azonexus sp.]
MKDTMCWMLLYRCMAFTLFISFGSLGEATAEVQKGYYDDPGIYPNRAYISDQYYERIDPFNG